MPKTRSARGELVDFDLLKIRNQLTEQPVSLDVKAREDFIDKKLRRRNRKLKQAAAAANPSAPSDGTVDSAALVAVETPPEGKLIDKQETVEATQEKKSTSKQKHRPPVK